MGCIHLNRLRLNWLLPKQIIWLLLFSVISCVQPAKANSELFMNDLIKTTVTEQNKLNADDGKNITLINAINLTLLHNPELAALAKEIGALGGSFIPNAMGLSKQYTGTFAYGFLSFAILAAVAFMVLRIAQRKWTKSWVAKGGKAITK
ncbi:MAG TPA: hypothetical protein PLL07_00510, partial [Nitrosomonas sp.]|nr:hypothetical protein [Nitrosomonas sp.]